MRSRRPRKKTIEILEFINSSSISGKELIGEIVSKFNIGENRSRVLLRQFATEGLELISKYGVKNEVVVSSSSSEVGGPIVLSNVEKLPRTEDELKAYRYDKVLSPEALKKNVCSFKGENKCNIQTQ